jgi:2-methylcitrate dehydratase
MNNGETIVDELAMANAHPLGARPFKRDNYVQKFKTLTEGLITESESKRFLNAAANLTDLKGEQLRELNVELPLDKLERNSRDERGIF